MAQRLGIPTGTVKSRSYTLVRQGKIQPRQRGRISAPPLVPAPVEQKPVQSGAYAPGSAEQRPVHTVHRVQAQLYALHGAVQSDVAPEDLKSERWNVYMPRWLRRLVEAEAAAAHLSPSQVLQDVVKAWAEQRTRVHEGHESG
jgi:hypothetical protein